MALPGGPEGRQQRRAPPRAEDRRGVAGERGGAAAGRPAGDIWLQTAAEVKLTVDPARRDADDKTKRHVCGRPKDEDVERPAGEWNDYRIVCRGGSIELAVNGRVVNGGTECNLTRGRIALQAEGTDVEFKDITIRMLK